MSRYPMILRKKSRITGRKVIDISEECDRISEICKDIAETKQIPKPEARGERCKPSAEDLQATSCVARDDRDGCSRYRASKMSPVGTN